MESFSAFGRILTLIGLVLVGVGLLLTVFGKVPWLGDLPGDFYYQGENFAVYFPLATCIVLSIILSLLVYLINFLSG